MLCERSVRTDSRLLRLAAIALLTTAGALHAQTTLTQGTNLSVDAASDGRLAIDLLGGIWIVPPPGGQTVALTDGPLPARRPKWSPDSTSIVYQARSGSQDQLWLYRFDDEAARTISDGRYQDQHPDWHPDGERLVYSSDRRDSAFDLWEIDLPTGLTWRISHQPGDETEPTWSADGRDLTYVHRIDDQWSLMLRRHGLPDEVLVTSALRLSAPSWRPDGSLITFLRHGDEGLSIDMVVLSDPLLIRTLVSDEDFFVAPVTWLDRQQMLYAANGVIRKRPFNSWTSTTVPFRATIRHEKVEHAVQRPHRELPSFDEPNGKLVIRVSRMFDGIGSGYREGLDIVIDGGQIVAVEQQRERSGVIDMGNLTALPGFIDGYAALPGDAGESLGPLLLSYGVTTLVADHANSEALNRRWSGQDMPGPRLLSVSDIATAQTGTELPWLVTLSGDMTAGLKRRADVASWLSLGVPVLADNWQVGLGSGATMLLGVESMPASPGSLRYDDIRLANRTTTITIVSGLADAQTPDLAALLQSRQAHLLRTHDTVMRRFPVRPQLAHVASTIVLGSKPNGLPPGIALHAELRALKQAGLHTQQVLRTAGINVSAALGFGLRLGRIAIGGKADLVLVDGDPLTNINDAQKVVAVVRNGRFFSTIGLIERAEPPRE